MKYGDLANVCSGSIAAFSSHVAWMTASGPEVFGQAISCYFTQLF